MSRTISDGLFAIADELRNLGLVLAGAPVFVRKLDIEVDEHGRCARCHGSGLIEGGFCNCQMGRDLGRVETYTR